MVYNLKRSSQPPVTYFFSDQKVLRGERPIDRDNGRSRVEVALGGFKNRLGHNSKGSGQVVAVLDLRLVVSLAPSN